MRTIETKNAPAAIGPYSQAVVSGGLVYTSGQIPVDPVTGAIEAAGIAEQTHQALRNLASVLEAAGSGLGKVIRTTCFLRDMNDLSGFNEVYAQYFPGRPARSCAGASGLPKGALLEIDAVAEIDDD